MLMKSKRFTRDSFYQVALVREFDMFFAYHEANSCFAFAVFSAEHQKMVVRCLVLRLIKNCREFSFFSTRIDLSNLNDFDSIEL